MSVALRQNVHPFNAFTLHTAYIANPLKYFTAKKIYLKGTIKHLAAFWFFNLALVEVNILFFYAYVFFFLSYILKYFFLP